MSSDIVNLRVARKAKAKAARQAEAAENRVRFGRTKQQRVSEADQKSRIEREIDGARREVPHDAGGRKPAGGRGGDGGK